MTQQQFLEEIKQLSIAERIALIEAIFRSLREDLEISSGNAPLSGGETHEAGIEKERERRLAAVRRLRGALKTSRNIPSDEELKDDYTNYLIEILLMRVLLDTDVVLDYLLEREPFAQAAGQLLELNAQGVFEGYVSGSTPINAFYIARKIMERDKLMLILNDLLLAVRVCPITQDVLKQALALPFADYEDAVQHASAAANQLDAIITRNLDDYRNAMLPVFSPTAFLNQLTSDRE